MYVDSFAYFSLSQWGKIIRIPLVKFLNYAASYLAFLILLFVATTHARTGEDDDVLRDNILDGVVKLDDVLDILICLYVIGKLDNEICIKFDKVILTLLLFSFEYTSKVYLTFVLLSFRHKSH